MRDWRWERYLGGIILLLGMIAGAHAHGDTPPPIALIPQDGFNLEVVDQINPHYVIIKLASPAHNWFAGAFTNLPTDKDVTIGLSMAGNDTKGNAADVKKWVGLMPVMTYADPTQYETYEWFQKDAQGRWVSGDIFKQGEAKFAGNGKVPDQSAIPTDVAEQFLSADGKYWSAWREVDKAEAFDKLNVFRITQRFARPTATVAMRVPYTYTYLQAFLAKLQAAKLPGVTVETIGDTPEKRKLQCMRIEPVEAHKAEDAYTILFIAREHATEHAASWALQGALHSILCADANSTQRTQQTWLFLPIQDPDGSATGQFDRLTERFRDPYAKTTPPEVLTYARYFTAYINAGRSIDIAVSLHNVEATEGPHVFCPFADARFPEAITAVNAAFFAELAAEQFATGAPTPQWGRGWMNFRLYGWCALQFGTFDLTYEVNDRLPGKPLALSRLQRLGEMLAHRLVIWGDSEAGRAQRQVQAAHLSARAAARTAYFTRERRRPDQRSLFDILSMGY